MKKLNLFLLVFVISLFTGSLFAQGAYVNINAGYGFSTSSSNLYFFDFYNSSGSSGTYTEEQVCVSLGKGFNFGGTFGYMFNKNVGAELGINYLLGGKSEAKDEWSGGGNATYNLSSKMLRFSPSIIIAAGFEGVNPYARFGAIIGTGKVVYEYDETDDGDNMKMSMDLNGGIALGLNAAIGANFSISDNMSLFGEINMVNMSYAPKKGEITEATYNGTDLLPDMTTRDKEIEFVDSYTYSYDNPPAESEPEKELKQYLPFGSIGISFGLRIDL
jgi:hypothetical protein